MSRPAGKKNADFDAKASAQLERLSGAWLRLGPGASLRELAADADLSPNNVRHYFGDRDELVAAMLAHLRAQGQPYMALASEAGAGDAEEVLRQFLRGILVAWRRFGVGRMHGVTLAEGLAGGPRGPAYVAEILEPTLVTLETLLGRLVEDGRLPTLDPRVAGLALLGPVVLALLHQDNLGGVACRPLDVEAYAEAQLQGWLRGWGHTSKRSV